MMIVALAIGLLYVSAIWMPRILVALIAALIAVMLAQKARRLTRTMLANSMRHLDHVDKASRAERRLMRASLQVALNQTELRSLFPTLVSCASTKVTR